MQDETKDVRDFISTPDQSFSSVDMQQAQYTKRRSFDEPK